MLSHFYSRCTVWLLFGLALFFTPSGHACEWQFSLQDGKPLSGLQQLPRFITQQVRPLLQAQPTTKPARLELAWHCQPEASEKSLRVQFELDPASLTLQGLAGLPLCAGIQGTGMCEKGQYDFRGYRHGGNSLLNSTSMLRALKTLAPIRSRVDLQRAHNNLQQRHAVHDALNLFSIVLTEAARFESVHDDVNCMATLGQSFSVSNYWRLIQNWETISQRVMQYQPQLRPASANAGPGSLFVPLDNAMIEAFNRSLKTHPASEADVTFDGKNKEIAVNKNPCAQTRRVEETPQQRERDDLFTLATMAMVLKDWQHDPSGRGHNIGTLLVDQHAKPVYWARNAVRTLNTTQHGEVRAIQGLLACPGMSKNLKTYTLYTTLEPCAMCAGMISMSQIERVVYLQNDAVFGQIRQALDNLGYLRRYEQATPDHLPQKHQLEAHFENHRRSSGNSAITQFLLGKEARKVFESAQEALEHYEVRFTENAPLLANLKQWMQSVTTETYGDAMLARCPAQDVANPAAKK